MKEHQKTSHPVERRIDALLNELTVEEKHGMLTGESDALEKENR